MSPKAKAAYDKAQEAFDTHCQKLSVDEYLEYIEEMEDHVAAVKQCWHDEHDDDEE